MPTLAVAGGLALGSGGPRPRDPTLAVASSKWARSRPAPSQACECLLPLPAAKHGYGAQAAYYASKGALIPLAKSLALAW